ncbi:hypothetical protein FOCC_FOCC016455 [Frankliniella occidentalis]|nr:hypothetical protein FOCC_FOCC016455 [Frankliniella occidentalis]
MLCPEDSLPHVVTLCWRRQRLEAEHHRLREEQQRRAEVRLKERLTRLTPAWRSIQYSTEEDLALRAAARRQEEREQRREHGQLMRHMLHRVHTIPTLFERQSAHRLLCSVDFCGSPAALDDEDEDAADVKGRRRHRGSPPVSAVSALRSPDRQSGRLRSYHRQLPHRVEFSESPALSAHGEDDGDGYPEEDGGAGAPSARDGGEAGEG